MPKLISFEELQRAEEYCIQLNSEFDVAQTERTELREAPSSVKLSPGNF